MVDTAKVYRDEDRLTPENAALVMIDHQTGLLSACRDIPTEKLYSNVLALAKIGKAFDLPVVLTQGGYGGENPGGPLMHELIELFPNTPVISRYHVNAYDDLHFRQAIKDTGRRKLIMAGCTTDVCLAFPAMSAVADGYDVYAVIDASGNWDLLTTQAAMIRISQAGVIVTNWVGIWGELLRDHKHPKDQETMQTVAQHIPAMGMVTNNWMYANKMYPEFKEVR